MMTLVVFVIDGSAEGMISDQAPNSSPRHPVKKVPDATNIAIYCRRPQQTSSTPEIMPLYYDFESMDLSTPRLRSQYVLRYAIKIILSAYRAVTETSRASGPEIQMRMASTVAELIESDEIIDAASSLFKEELKVCATLLSSTPKERENMWKRALGYKKDIKNWNSKAPGVKEVPSGETDCTAWRHTKLRQRLFLEKNPDKTEDDMPSHFQPSIVWPAYVALEMINDHKFNLLERDDDEPLKSTTKSRSQQREESRLVKVESRAAKVARQDSDKFVSPTFIQIGQQRNAEALIAQKGRELQKSQMADLFHSSLSILNAARDGALDVLSPGSKAEILRQAGVGTRSALRSMVDMVKKPTEVYVLEISSDDEDFGTKTPAKTPAKSDSTVPVQTVAPTPAITPSSPKRIHPTCESLFSGSS